MRWQFAALCSLAAIGLACSRPVPVRPEAPAVAEKPVAACPPCECEACPACPACPAPPEAAPAVVPADTTPVEIPAHLRPTREQCKGACDKLMELEVRRAMNRMTEAQPELIDALKKGLAEEKGLLAESCIKRCLAEFTVNTALCMRKFDDVEKVRQCVFETSPPGKP